jgi:hypothetical protein
MVLLWLLVVVVMAELNVLYTATNPTIQDIYFYPAKTPGQTCVRYLDDMSWHRSGFNFYKAGPWFQPPGSGFITMWGKAK